MPGKGIMSGIANEDFVARAKQKECGRKEQKLMLKS